MNSYYGCFANNPFESPCDSLQDSVPYKKLQITASLSSQQISHFHYRSVSISSSSQATTHFRWTPLSKRQPQPISKFSPLLYPTSKCGHCFQRIPLCLEPSTIKSLYLKSPYLDRSFQHSLWSVEHMLLHLTVPFSNITTGFAEYILVLAKRKGETERDRWEDSAALWHQNLKPQSQAVSPKT